MYKGKHCTIHCVKKKTSQEYGRQQWRLLPSLTIIEDDVSWFKKLKKKRIRCHVNEENGRCVEQSASASKTRATETGLAKVKQRTGPL